MGVFMSIFEMLFSIRNLANELEVMKWLWSRINKYFLVFQVPFKEELIKELKFIMQCTGNTKTVYIKKKSCSRGVSLEHESRSVSRSTCSHTRELTSADAYGFRPSIKNLEKLDLMPDVEVAEDV